MEPCCFYNQRDFISRLVSYLCRLSVVSSTCQLTWGFSCSAWANLICCDPCQPIRLLLSDSKSGPFWAVFSCHSSNAPTRPTSTFHLWSSHSGIYKINLRRKAAMWHHIETQQRQWDLNSSIFVCDLKASLSVCLGATCLNHQPVKAGNSPWDPKLQRPTKLPES